MQQALYENLVRKYGESQVAAECIMSSGNPADIVVQSDTGLEVYEIKTSLLPRQCIRQAIGQLLEYGYWPGSDVISRLWVVGPRKIDNTASWYIESLNSRFFLPLGYVCQPKGDL
jgi:hypothetical protein